MLIKNSIKSRMLIMVGACLGLIVVSLVAIAIYRADANARLVSVEAQGLLKDAADKILVAEAGLQSAAVQKYFQGAYQSGLDISTSAVQVRKMIRDGSLESLTGRIELINLVSDNLKLHSELLSLYIISSLTHSMVMTSYLWEGMTLGATRSVDFLSMRRSRMGALLFRRHLSLLSLIRPLHLMVLSSIVGIPVPKHPLSRVCYLLILTTHRVGKH